jgi:hypothetical protein
LSAEHPQDSVVGDGGAPSARLDRYRSRRAGGRGGADLLDRLPPAVQRPELARAVVFEPDKYVRGGRILGVEFDRIAHRDPARFHG